MRQRHYSNWLILLLVLFAVPLTLASQAIAATQPADIAGWQWSSQCSSPRRFEAEVILNRQKIYTTVFDICRLPLPNGATKTQRILKFDLASPRESLFGEHKGERLEGNIWEAGRDSDALLLGVSFVGPKQIWCNTIHVVYPERSSKTLLARGFQIRTHPVH